MMGQLRSGQNSLFYDFCLEQHVPKDHLLRQIDQFLDFETIRRHLRPYYSRIGRPSIDPELMIRMLLIGYCYGIHSERRLCEDVSLNLAYRWFCRLGLEDDVPDHSTFSKNRHGRFRDSDILRFVFNMIVTRCIDEGLVGGEGFAIDASFVRADVARQRYEHAPVDWTPAKTQSRAVREYLAKLDQDESLRRPQKSVSLTDPMAQWTGAKGPADFFYSTNYLIDVDHNVIMDVAPSPSTKKLEVETTETMIERVEAEHGIRPGRLMGDTAYGSAENLAYLVDDKRIEPHIPVHDRTSLSGDKFSVSDFEWNAEKDEHICPAGKSLQHLRRNFTKPRLGITKANTRLYRSSAADCRDCPLKQRCCPNTEGRKIARNVHESARTVARQITESSEYTDVTCKQRKKVEMMFAHMKRHFRFNRLRLRGLSGASDEFLLVATAQNLRKLAKLCSQPPPNYGVGAS